MTLWQLRGPLCPALLCTMSGLISCSWVRGGAEVTCLISSRAPPVSAVTYGDWWGAITDNIVTLSCLTPGHPTHQPSAFLIWSPRTFSAGWTLYWQTTHTHLCIFRPQSLLSSHHSCRRYMASYIVLLNINIAKCNNYLNKGQPLATKTILAKVFNGHCELESTAAAQLQSRGQRGSAG